MHIDKTFTAIDHALAQLSRVHPGLKVLFDFNIRLPPRPYNEMDFELEFELRKSLPLFLAQRGDGELRMTLYPKSIYGSRRVVKL